MTSEEKAKALDEDCERSSVSVTYDKNMQIVDTNNYYPFGMNHLRDDAPSNFGQGSYKNYKFQEQELQETGFYSFKWRNYMPDVGRFFNVDPLSEKYAYQAHYNFSENRVVSHRELEGLEAVESITSGKIIHSWKGTNKANSVGIDSIHESKVSYNTTYDSHQLPVAQAKITTITDAKIDKVGKISNVHTFVSMFVENLENGATTTHATSYDTDINSNVVSDTFKEYTKTASNFKKSDDGGSLVQVEAVHNREDNKIKTNVIGINIGGEFTVAGGATGALQYAYFLDGKDKFQGGYFYTAQGTLGLSAGGGVSAFAGDFIGSKGDANLTMNDFLGNAASYNIGVEFVSRSYWWGNNLTRHQLELFPRMGKIYESKNRKIDPDFKYQKTWSGYSLGAAIGVPNIRGGASIGHGVTKYLKWANKMFNTAPHTKGYQYE